MMNINNYLCLDIENDADPKHKQYGRDAGNFKFDGIVAVGYKPFDAKVFSCYSNPPSKKMMLVIPDNVSILVGHHFTHDLLFLWEDQELQDFLKRGGRIWDTQYAHYCLIGQEETYPALRDIAVRCYGLQEREKVMEKYWKDDVKVLDWSTKKILFSFPKHTNRLRVVKYLDDNKITQSVDIVYQSMQTSQIPEELVRYDVENDVLDTEQIYLQQIKLAADMGMLPLLLAQMDAILATTEMTYNGVYVDRQVLRKNKAELEKDVLRIELELNQIIQEYWK